MALSAGWSACQKHSMDHTRYRTIYTQIKHDGKKWVRNYGARNNKSKMRRKGSIFWIKLNDNMYLDLMKSYLFEVMPPWGSGIFSNQWRAFWWGVKWIESCHMTSESEEWLVFQCRKPFFHLSPPLFDANNWCLPMILVLVLPWKLIWCIS